LCLKKLSGTRIKSSLSVIFSWSTPRNLGGLHHKAYVLTKHKNIRHIPSLFSIASILHSLTNTHNHFVSFSSKYEEEKSYPKHVKSK
jgi:hypothetical protein